MYVHFALDLTLRLWFISQTHSDSSSGSLGSVSCLSQGHELDVSSVQCLLDPAARVQVQASYQLGSRTGL